jgi:hypothetical protein
MQPYCQPRQHEKYLANQVPDLLGFRKATARSIANGPASFFLGFKFAVLQQMDERGDEVRVNDRLNLIAITGCDIGYRPTGFLSNGFLRAREKTK